MVTMFLQKMMSDEMSQQKFINKVLKLAEHDQKFCAGVFPVLENSQMQVWGKGPTSPDSVDGEGYKRGPQKQKMDASSSPDRLL